MPELARAPADVRHRAEDIIKLERLGDGCCHSQVFRLCANIAGTIGGVAKSAICQQVIDCP